MEKFTKALLDNETTVKKNKKKWLGVIAILLCFSIFVVNYESKSSNMNNLLEANNKDDAYPTDLKGKINYKTEVCPNSKGYLTSETECKRLQSKDLYQLSPAEKIEMDEIKEITLSLSKYDGLGRLKSSDGKIDVECGGVKTLHYEKYNNISLFPERKYRALWTSIGVCLEWTVAIDTTKGSEYYFHTAAYLNDSLGCIHLCEADAKNFYNWLDRETILYVNWIE